MVHEMFQDQIDLQPGDKFFFTRIRTTNGTTNMSRVGSDLNPLELLGLLKFISDDVEQQINHASISPDIVTKTYIEQEEAKP